MAMNNRVRSKAEFLPTGTAKTITFDEATPLDATHLLVAVIQSANSTGGTLPSGWTSIFTEASTGTAGGNMRLQVWTKQGDGATNSLSWTGTINSTAFLIGYEGYVDVAALTTSLTGDEPTATTAWTFPTPTPVMGEGIALFMGESNAEMVVASITGTGTVIPSAASARLFVIGDQYSNASVDLGKIVNLTTALAGNMGRVVLPLIVTEWQVSGTVPVRTSVVGNTTIPGKECVWPPYWTATWCEPIVSHQVSGTAAVVTTTSGAATVVAPSGVTHVIEAVAWDYALLAGG